MSLPVRLFIFFYYLLPALGCAAQGSPGLGLEANITAGRILKHSAKFKAPIPALSMAFELAAIKITDGSKDWQQRRHYPVFGVGVSYTDYGRDSVFGRAVGVYPVIQFYIVRHKSFEWTFRLGLGLGYVSRHYQYAPVADTLNNAISTHINNFSLFSTDLRWHLNSHWDAQAGINFSHISNAAFQQPNLGVNMYGAHIGVRYFPATSQPLRISRELPSLRNRLLVQARAGIAFNGSGNYGGPLYRTYLATAYVSRRYLSKSKAYIGLDYSYHERIYAFLKNNEIFPGEEAAHSWKSAVIIGNEWMYGRGALVGQVGYYLQEAYLRQNKVYEKIGYHYYLLRREKGGLKELFLTAYLKTHLTIAELAEFGVGMGF